MCYHAEFGRSALKLIGINRAYTRTSKSGEPWNSAFLGWEAWLTPRFTPLPHMCHHIKIGSSAIKSVRINRKKPQKLGSAGTPPPLGAEVADP